MANITTGTSKFASKVQALAVLMAVVLVAEGWTSGVAATTGSCTSSMSSLAVCLPAIEGDNPPSPTDMCCAIVRATDTGCLCNLATEYSNAMGVNVRAALLLPKQCKHIIPAGYTCDGYLIPSYVPTHRKLMNA
ncbi:hypothetical protein M758_4G084600 [Ceratodon purpureus]|nr:hypothetical protein M758_4G084600 [Ceratodon purpureus]